MGRGRDYILMTQLEGIFGAVEASYPFFLLPQQWLCAPAPRNWLRASKEMEREGDGGKRSSSGS